MIDLRSDVVTKAPSEMLKIMSEAPCVNDPALDDLETNRFEEKLAKMFNKSGAVFFLNSSMSNLAACLLFTKPGSEVIISSSCHSVEHESASFARIAGVQTRQIFTESGTFTPQQGKLFLKLVK
jgi:threonine aldolase